MRLHISRLNVTTGLRLNLGFTDSHRWCSLTARVFCIKDCFCLFGIQILSHSGLKVYTQTHQTKQVGFPDKISLFFFHALECSILSVTLHFFLLFCLYLLLLWIRLRWLSPMTFFFWLIYLRSHNLPLCAICVQHQQVQQQQQLPLRKSGCSMQRGRCLPFLFHRWAKLINSVIDTMWVAEFA